MGRDDQVLDQAEADVAESATTDKPAINVEMAQRLKQARIAAGYKTGSEFSKRNGLAETTYHHHENGRRQISNENAKVYAKLLQVSIGHLLYGDELHTVTRVPIVGRIVKEGYVRMLEMSELDDEPSEAGRFQKSPRFEPKTVAIPNSDTIKGLLVIGQDMFPAMRHHDTVLYEPLTPIKTLTPDLHGVECVVRTADGRLLIRMISIQADGLATLFGWSVPPIFNVKVVAVAKIVGIMRSLVSQPSPEVPADA